MSMLRITTQLLTGGLDKGLQKARSSVREFSKSVSGQFAGVIAFGSIVAGIRSIMNEAERVSDVAAKFGVLPSEIKKLENVASVTGGSMSALNGALNAMWRRAQEAADGNEGYRRSFENLGISVDQLRGKNATEIFNMISDGVQNTTDKSVAFAAAFAVGGEQARELFTMLGMGSEEIDRLGASMGAMSDDTTQRLAKINTDFRTFGNHLKVYGGETIALLVKSWQTLVAYVVGMAPTVMTAVKEMTKPWQAWGQMIGGAISGLGGLSSALIKVFKLDFKGAFEDGKMAGKHLVDGIKTGVETAGSISIDKIKTQFEEDTDVLASVLGDMWGEHEEREKNRQPPSFPEIGATGSSEQDSLASHRGRVAEREWEIALKRMSAEEQLAEMLRKQAEYREAANEDTKEGLDARLKELALEERIMRLKDQVEKDSEKGTPADNSTSLSSDFLARVGGGMSGINTPEKAQLDVAKDQLKVQEKMLIALENPPVTDQRMKT